MFLSQTAPQVLEVSPAPVGTIIMPIWLLTMFVALIIMMLFLAIGRRKPHSIFNWLSLLFFVAAMVAASQTNLATNVNRSVQVFFESILTAISVVVVSPELTVGLLAFVLLLVCIYLYYRGLSADAPAVQIGMALLISLIVIFLSKVSDQTQQFTAWLIEVPVGFMLVGIMSVLGGGAVEVAASTSRASVEVPAWIGLSIFSFMLMLLFLSRSRKHAENKEEKGRKTANGWALAFATVAIVSAATAPFFTHLQAGVANVVGASQSSLEKANFQMNSAVIAAVLLAVVLLLHSSSDRIGSRIKEPEKQQKVAKRIRLSAIILAPLLIITLVQSSPLALQATSLLIGLATIGMEFVVNFAQVI